MCLVAAKTSPMCALRVGAGGGQNEELENMNCEDAPVWMIKPLVVDLELL